MFSLCTHQIIVFLFICRIKRKMSIVKFFLFLMVGGFISMVDAIIAYDCTSDHTNITRISMISSTDCNYQKYQPEVSRERIQLLQLADVTPIHIYQCKYQVDRLITHCGMHSHASMVKGSFQSFIKEIHRDECLNIHHHQTLKTSSGLIIEGIALNGTTKFVDVVAGTINTNSDCTGAYFSDSRNEYADVVVQYSITLTIRDFTASVLSSGDTVIIEGLRCDYSKGHCMDSNYGQSFWSHNSNPSCYETTYDVLYEGLANKAIIVSPTTGLNETVYSVVNGDTIFALQIKGDIDLCSSFGHQTEHPRLFIVPYVQKSKAFSKKQVLTKNLDMFAYINSKFVYSERHIRNELNTIYIDVLTKICETERDLLQTQLSFAKLDPPGFAFMRTKQPGYTATLLGEILYLIKCVPIEVEIRKADLCFNELPVAYKNRSMFMTPMNHLLQPHGKVVECTSFMTPAYQLLNVWYNLFPVLHKTESPKSLDVNSRFTWSYTDPGNLASAGIYSQQDLDGLKKQIMFPSEREVITNAMVRKILSPGETDQQNLNIGNLMDENKLKKMFSQAWDSAWQAFTSFGLIMSTIMGIIMVLKTIKFLIDTLIHAYSLHAIFGWSIQLLGAFWDVVTYLLIRGHNGRAGRTPGLYPDLEAAGLEPLNRDDNLYHLSPRGAVTSESTSSTITPSAPAILTMETETELKPIKINGNKNESDVVSQPITGHTNLIPYN